ncbi:MAG: Fe-S cluster assembly sulfur transfer protein SufU [Planctomycetota bacterium]|jgi:nitrogen fixation NifU-like protein
MNELRDLYQEMILEHSRSPRNRRVIDEDAGDVHHADGHNPLCGDEVTVYVRLEGGTVADVSFEGSGCAISTASASILTETLRGKTREEAEEVFRRFHELVTGKSEASDEMGKLLVFGGVSEFPARVKCATLASHTLRAAIEEQPADGPVTTE